MISAGRRLAGHPAVHRQQPGQLRLLRQARSSRLEDAAVRAGITPSTLPRIENGRAPARTRYLSILVDVHGLDDPAQRARLLGTARGGHGRSWWAGCGGVLPAGTGGCLHHEAAADGIAVPAPHVIPELAQTPDYACARPASPALTDAGNRLIAAHQAARAAHLRPGRRLHLLIGRTALRRPVAPLQVMAAQFRHLLGLAAEPSATVQVIAAAAPVLSPPSTLFTYTEPAAPGTAAFTALTQAALPADDSATLMRGLGQHTQPDRPTGRQPD